MNQDVQVQSFSAALLRLIRANDALNRASARQARGLTPQQVQAVMQLSRHEFMTSRDLARAMDLSSAWISRLVEELVARGHVVREANSGGDRRLVRLRLTPNARSWGLQITQQRNEQLARVLADVPDATRQAAMHVLTRLSEEFERATQEENVADRSEAQRP